MLIYENKDGGRLEMFLSSKYNQTKSQASGSSEDKKKPFYSNMEYQIPYVVCQETMGNYACHSPVQSQEE